MSYHERPHPGNPQSNFPRTGQRLVDADWAAHHTAQIYAREFINKFIEFYRKPPGERNLLARQHAAYRSELHLYIPAPGTPRPKGIGVAKCTQAAFRYAMCYTPDSFYDTTDLLRYAEVYSSIYTQVFLKYYPVGADAWGAMIARVQRNKIHQVRTQEALEEITGHKVTWASNHTPGGTSNGRD